MKEINRSYKFRIYPTAKQIEQLEKSFGCARFIYNWGLAKKKEAFEKENIKLSYVDLAKELTVLKKDLEWLQEPSNINLQQSLRDLDNAYSRFFKKVSKYPKFKKKSNKQSIRYTNLGFRFKESGFFLAKQDEPLDIRYSRKIEGIVSSVTVSKNPDNRYYISFCSTEMYEPKPLKSAKQVGIDLGIKTFATLSDCTKINSPRFSQKKIKRLQQILSKKQKGSSNYKKLQLRIARLHSKEANKRLDFLHKLSTKIVSENQAIVVEDLNINRMLKKKSIAKIAGKLGWRMFLDMLQYKANWNDRDFIKVDRYFPSSKTCSCCNHINTDLKLHHRKWLCPQCGTLHDRDINAAINIVNYVYS